MSRILNTSIIAASALSLVLGFWISNSIEEGKEYTANSELPLPPTLSSEDKSEYSVPRFAFSDPFDPRKELDYALSLEDTTERYGRLFAIGFQSAQESPEQNLAVLAPEIWDYPNYDLRGAFYSEWMRSYPESFLSHAEEKYAELAHSHKTKLFPTYHLSYMEPHALLELLPKITNTKLKNRARSELLATLVELDPSLLWERRDEIGSSQAIISEASNKGLYELALEFWELSGWEEIFFNDDQYTYMAKNHLTGYASHLVGYQKTMFASAYARENPAEAAKWVRAQERLVEIEYEFDPEHAAFFKHLFALENFPGWADASAWICESISADDPCENRHSIFSVIEAAPEACHFTRLKDEFFDYLDLLEDKKPIKKLYLAIENDHPILETLEQYMLQFSEEFSDAIVARTTREAPTPERLMQVLEMGNLDAWPDAYFVAARDTLNSLGDQDLIWSLSPSMLLSAQEIAPERIQNMLSTADPTWLSNTLNSSEFHANATIKQLEVIPELLGDLPEEDAQNILNTARSSVLRNAYLSKDKIPYLQIAQNQKEVLLVAGGIDIDSFLQDQTLKKEIAKNPYSDDIYLTIANNYQFTHKDADDPNLQQALDRIEVGRELSHKSESVIVSTIQSLPSNERFLAAKAVLMSNYNDSTTKHSEKIAELPFWSESEVEQLKSLSFTQMVNFNIDHPDFIW